MGEYDRATANALRLIKKKGVKANWRQIRTVLVDPNEPFGDTTQQVTNTDVMIVFLPLNKEMRETMTFIKGTEVHTGSVMGLMGKVPFEPDASDVVINSRGEQLAIDNIQTVAPNDVAVLYTVVFKK